MVSRTNTLAASLISAGLASLITAYVMEKQKLKEIDERVQAEVEASVNFLVETGQAEQIEVDDAEARELHAEVFGTDRTKADSVGKNQRTRYDKVVKSRGYSDEAENPDEVEACEIVAEIHTISTEEFMENENGWPQSSVSYFADGGVLDELGELVVDFEDLIGSGVPPFGVDSGEPHIVYLRNTKLQREFEVIQDEANAADILATPGSTP